jgi:hypothetical protein
MVQGRRLLGLIVTAMILFDGGWTLTDFRGSARKELSRFSLDKIFSDFV